MRNRVGTALIVLAVLLFLNAIFGRYIVLPGYIESLEAGRGTVTDVSQHVPGWKIARYLFWAYSFKLGFLFLLAGAMLRTTMSTARFWIFSVTGFVYVGFAYMPLPAAPSIVYGLGGSVMTVLMVLIVIGWTRQRSRLPEEERRASDLQVAGLFFFAMATYTICGLMGTRTFALEPERMIQYGLQADAASFALHLLIELVLAWAFTFLGFRRPAAA